MSPIRNPPRPQKLNQSGNPVLYPCPHGCEQDFNGKEMLRRHHDRRTGHCKSVQEMWNMGWYMDRYGRWRQRHGHAKPDAKIVSSDHRSDEGAP